MKKQAFTLIELLIVVAIIAILAAIAVPNFLEAQTRAKVSRAKTDLRTISVAVESYAVDHNKYPPDGDDTRTTDQMAIMARYAQKAWFAILTTPVAYISSAPFDPFNTKAHTNPMDMTAILFPGAPPHVYSFMTDGGYYPNPLYPLQIAHGGNPSKYGITSLGPDQTFNSSTFGDAKTMEEHVVQVSYDATNGTVSAGDIVRRGPGRGE
jgi:prepilin-type N-terminal cleavage/methylation domain-containing protein